MKRFRIKFGFRGKVYAGIVVIILLSGLLMAFSVSTIVAKALSNESKHRGLSAAMSLAARSRDPILAMDFLRMKNLLDDVLASEDDISYAFIFDKHGQILAHTFTGSFPADLTRVYTGLKNDDFSIRLLKTGNDLVYDFAAPATIGDHRIGIVQLGLSKRKIRQTINDLLWMIFLLTGLSISIAGLAGAGFADQVTKRIKRLREASDEALRGNLDVQAAPLLKKNCWEIVNCEKKECPAYGDRYRRCWYHAGTMCPECVDGDYAVRLESCQSCQIFMKLSGDEIQCLAESFDAMTLARRNYIARLAESKAMLEKSEVKYRHIFEASVDMIFIADSRGDFVEINHAGISMLEYDSMNEMIQAVNTGDIIIEPDSIDNLFREVDSTGFTKDWECILKTKNGREIQVLVSCTAHIDENGETIGYEGIVKDITVRKNMEAQLLQADRLASLGELAAGVAHEVNNPLGLVLGYTQLLIRDELKGGQKYDDLKTIEKHTLNCKLIVKALLNFARRTETRRARININRIIEDVITVVGIQFKMDNIQIKKVFSDDVPMLTGDAEKLKQVFINLLINAGQAISGSGSITITTKYIKEKDKITVTIEDTGQGIPPDIINRIFDPFFTTKPVGQGTGLGLSVSYGIIKEHNGEISVRSEPDMGASFKVELPVKPTAFGLTT